MSEQIGELVQVAVSYLRHERRLGAVVVVLLCLLVVAILDRLIDLFRRRVPLTPEQQERLALAAPYFTVHGFRAGDLGGLRPIGRTRVNHSMRRDWGIEDTTSAHHRLDDLLRHGHRSDPRYQDSRQPREDQELVDRALLAWDAMRLVFIARCCFAVGYVDEATVWRYTDAAAALARQGFADWERWGRAFLDGRVVWGGEARSYYELVVDRLQRGNGLWTRVPWAAATRAARARR